MTDIWHTIIAMLGLDSSSLELSVPQMALRALIVYVIALAMVRLGDKRFFGQNTAFDLILGIIFGSIVSRAITGQSAFFPTLGAALMVILVHWLLAVIAFRFDSLSAFIKGDSRVLIKDGEIQWESMRRSHIGKHDLMSALRANGSLNSIEDVQEAHIERSGNISVIPKKRAPKILEVQVREGVQTVRIELG
jgi:uncharacterized membrane protein YcaP (DUF421 family)